MSEPVRTQFGWHLIQLHERIPEKITPFEEISEKVVEYLTERKKDKVFEDFLDGLKASGNYRGSNRNLINFPKSFEDLEGALRFIQGIEMGIRGLPSIKGL